VPWLDMCLEGQDGKARMGSFPSDERAVGMHGLCLGMDHEPVKSLMNRIRGQRYVGNVAVGVCYRPHVGKK